MLRLRGRGGGGRRLVLLAGSLVLAASPTPARAAAGDLDPSWSGDGMVFTDVYGLHSYANDLAIQSDGRVVAVGVTLDGNGSFAIMRYLPGGRRDVSFGDRGRVRTDFSARFDGAEDVAIQTNGKIVVAGEAGGRPDSFAVARYRPGGRLDPDFSGNGKVMTSFRPRGPDGAAGLAIQGDGRIVVAGRACGNGRCRFALARYRRDGTLDATFGEGGRLTTGFVGGARASDVAIDPDGRIVVVGSSNHRFAVARYEPDGSLDATFSGNGKVRFRFGVTFQGAQGIALQDDGKIVAVGSGGPDPATFAIARYLTDGSPDAAFGGGDGMVNTCACGFYPVANGVAMQANGKIVAAGQADTFNIDSQFVLVRYLG